MLCLNQALDELEVEGGVQARMQRYQKNNRLLIDGMHALGFKPFLEPKHRGYIITSFHYLDHPNFDYKVFYEKIRELDCIIYSGKITNTACFRVGNIGRIFESDIRILLNAVYETLINMDILNSPYKEFQNV